MTKILFRRYQNWENQQRNTVGCFEYLHVKCLLHLHRILARKQMPIIWDISGGLWVMYINEGWLSHSSPVNRFVACGGWNNGRVQYEGWACSEPGMWYRSLKWRGSAKPEYTLIPGHIEPLETGQIPEHNINRSYAPLCECRLVFSRIGILK